MRAEAALSLAAIGFVACAGRQVVPPAAACAAPCATVEEVLHPDYVRVHVAVPAGTSLHNASVDAQQSPACGGGVAVAEVIVNGRLHAEGPAALSGNDIVALRFPFAVDGDEPALPVPPPHAVDLHLRGPAGPSCLRIPLPTPDGWLGFVRKLSFRLEPRP